MPAHPFRITCHRPILGTAVLCASLLSATGLPSIAAAAPGAHQGHNSGGSRSQIIGGSRDNHGAAPATARPVDARPDGARYR